MLGAAGPRVLGGVADEAQWRNWVTPGPVQLEIGAFVATLLDFLIVGFVAWRLTKLFVRPEPAAPAPPTKACPFCRMTIDAAATRCPHCTSELAE